MTTIYKALATTTESLGPRTIRVRMSTASVDLGGDIVVQEGIDLTLFRKNPVGLWSHDPAHPIAKISSISLVGGALVAVFEFYPEGISKKADEVCQIYKMGLLSGASIGFDPIEWEPITPGKPYGPRRYTKSQLMECSLVAIPCNTDAGTVARGLKSGRALSGENETALRAAHDAAEACRNGIASVLECVGGAGGGGEPAAGDTGKAARMARARALARPVEADLSSKAGRLRRAAELARAK